jgi:RNA polymerase sigma-70 factor, ECF subfamily
VLPDVWEAAVSRRKRGAPPPTEPFPPAFPPAEALYAHRASIAHALIACGIRSRDLKDVVQIVIMEAWKAIGGGRFRPDPSLDPNLAIRRFIHGICWRQASHHRERGYVRRELPVSEPWALAEEGYIELDAQLRARTALRALAELPERHREILIAVTDPPSLVEYARAKGINQHTAASRLRIAREAFAAKLRRRL